jgi:hypothetical protein
MKKIVAFKIDLKGEKPLSKHCLKDIAYSSEKQ